MMEKILLVDDEPGIRKVLGISLADDGYEVFTAEDGDEALKIFLKEFPQIVLTDIKMPGMDGIELLRCIKEEYPETEVIMLTGHGDMDLAVKSLKHDATDFVTKPINDDVLEIALQRARERINMRRKIRDYTLHLEEMVREKSEQLVKAERLAAVGQVVEGISSALRGLVDDLDDEGEVNIFNELPCFVSVHNRDLKILATNQLFTNRLGDKTGEGSWEVYRGPAANPHLCPVSRTFEKGGGTRTKEIVRGKNGEELPVIVHTSPIRNSDGEIDLVLEISADISEVRRLQEELWDTQARYHQLFEEAPCYITTIDREFKIQSANKLFKRDFGESTGNYCYELYQQRDAPCNNCPVARTFKDGELHQVEVLATNQSGKQYHLFISTAPIWDANDEIIQVIEMATDITQIRQLEDHLSNLGLLIGSISHSVKGLLTGLDGGMYLVERGFRKEDRTQIKEGWETVQTIVERIRRMVVDILYYAKERELEWERVDMLSFVDDIADTLLPKIRNHNIKMIRDFDASVGEFEIDPGVFRTALINLLENAVDACLEAAPKPDLCVTFKVYQEEDNIVFDISDNGVGMDEEKTKNLFNLFYSSKGRRGTGLGMYISNKVIRKHGGSIEVESRPGEGARLKVVLPKLPRMHGKALEQDYS